jgi:hypothetical protein
MPRAPNEEETARRKRAVFAVLGVLALVLLAFGVLGGGEGDRGLGGFFADRETTQGELPDGAPRHRRGRSDAGLHDRVSDAGTFAAHHEILPEVNDPQLPGPESDPGTSDDGPGQEFIDQYQGRSGRLSPQASIHGTRTSIPTRSHMAPPNVVAFTPSTIVSPGQTVVIHAVVHGRHSEDVTPDTIQIIVVNGTDPTSGTAQPMVPGDGEYTYAYVPTAEAHPLGEDGAPPIVSFIVRATGTYEGESYSRAATGTFNVHTPGARLDTEHAQASQRGSDIVVTVPVLIDRPGAYFGLAELWGGADGASPVAFGRDRVVYEQAGEQTFTFLFGGAVIRASGVDGPYVVRNVRFMQVDSIPPHQQSPTEELLTTPGWQSSDFH